ncbi:MAG TPA: hypothetical protein VMG08_10670 [Allosphingosinicella sp.]|nr:hypothetical protein [Allosphingosinicella sp.]
MKPIAAAAALIFTPFAVQGAQAPQPAPVAKRVCTVTATIGSRVNNTRRCRTQDEREQEKQEARRTVDRVQSYKATMCAPPAPMC